jgi:hypothetical protein
VGCLVDNSEVSLAQRLGVVNVIFLKVKRRGPRGGKFRLLNILAQLLRSSGHQKVLDISLPILLLVLHYLYLGLFPPCVNLLFHLSGRLCRRFQL